MSKTTHVISFRVSDAICKSAIAQYQATHAKHSNSTVSKNLIFRSLVLDALAAAPTTEQLSDVTNSLQTMQREIHGIQRSISTLRMTITLCWSKFVTHFAEGVEAELFDDLTTLLEDDSDVEP